MGGRYRLLSPLGAGAMGVVWRAEHVTLGTPVAVKLVDLEARDNAKETLGRFLTEARAAAKLKSPHVVHILDHGADGRVAYIAMELLEGESLAARLARQTALLPGEAMKVVREVALAVDRAHKSGVLHRDLKPANVFFAQAEGREVVKVLDFGIAKIVDTARRDTFVQTQEGQVMGTPAYMSPEQILGRPLDARSDLWQLGVIAFECVCGTLPFNGATVGDLFMRICSGPAPIPSTVAAVPEGFDAWFARAVQRDRRARFASALELAVALEPILCPGGAGPHGVDGSTARLVRTTARRPGARGDRTVWIGLAGGVAFAVVALGVLVALRRAPPPPPAPQAQAAAPAPATPEAPPPTPAPAAAPEAPSVTPGAELPPPTAAPSAPPPSGPRPSARPKSPTQRVEEELGL